MINNYNIFSALRAEMRSCLRLARTWVFFVFSMLFALGLCASQIFTHSFTSGASANQGLASAPELFTTNVAETTTLVFSIGMVFLTFDIRARDVRDQICEVIDSRPLTNFELLCGRTLGVALVAWSAFALSVGISVGILIGLHLFTEDYGAVPGLDGIAVLLLIGGIPGFLFLASSYSFLTTLVRHRLLAILACFGFTVLTFWIEIKVPIVWSNALATTIPYLDWPSAFTFDWPPLAVLAQRIGIVALSGLLLAFAALLYTRRDSTRPMQLATWGGGLLLVAVIGIGASPYIELETLDRVDRVAQKHIEIADDPRADVHSVGGAVSIKPSEELTIDLELVYRLPESSRDGSLVFSLNPGMEISSLMVDGAEVEWTHDDGLLTVTPEVSWVEGSDQSMRVVATGIPDPEHSYYNTPINPMRQTEMGSALLMLGTRPSDFAGEFVALVPGTRWYPFPGPNLDWRTDPEGSLDYFEVNIEVSVPDSWTVAGPGRTHKKSSAESRTFEFRPDAPVPEIGLIAAPFHRASMEVEGVTFELLLHRSHLRNLQYFSDAQQVLEDEIKELLLRHRFQSLDYPYSTFSVVEVPLSLRTYGGGWSMDSVQSMPGLVMMRETSFPLSRFSLLFQHLDDDADQDQEKLAQSKVQHLRRYFENDVNGGNVLSAFSHNQFKFLTSVSGPGSTPLNFFLNRLVLKTVADGADAFFNVYLFEDQRVYQQMTGITSVHASTRLFAEDDQPQFANIATKLRSSYSGRPSVWNAALDTALADIDYESDPALTISVMTLKTAAYADAYFDYLGERRVARLLADLRSRFTGTTFTVKQFEEIAEQLGMGLEPILGDWLHEPGLPGFEVSHGTSKRLQDLADGSTLYESSFHLRNSQPSPGIVKLAGESRGDTNRDNRSHGLGGPLLVPGNTSYRINAYTVEPIDEVRVTPYLSLNRASVAIQIPEPDETNTSNEQPRELAEPSDWRPNRSEVLVIDDLDEGFTLTFDDPPEPPSGLVVWLLKTFGPQVIVDDQGISEVNSVGPSGNVQADADRWQRVQSPLSFGRYRQTHVKSPAKTIGARGAFAAEIPFAGTWELEYHIPGRQARSRGGPSEIELSLGTGKGADSDVPLVFVIANAGSEQSAEFAAGKGEVGWNMIGNFELELGEVRVVVQHKSEERLTLDAVRLTYRDG